MKHRKRSRSNIYLCIIKCQTYTSSYGENSYCVIRAELQPSLQPVGHDNGVHLTKLNYLPNLPTKQTTSPAPQVDYCEKVKSKHQNPL
ncbi:Hypothetical predicted protein, partial [Scomber scombrus]